MKSTVRELAAFGGSKTFAEPLHVGRPNIGDREALLGRINDMLDRRWLTNNGTYVREFEQRLAEILNVKHCVAMCNGSVALEIATRAVGLGGEVIVPSFTFVATAHALQWQEITPVFCDIDPETYCIDPARVEELITPRTTGIIGVHLWGRPCDVEALDGIAKRHNIKLLFDAAHALGCSYRGEMVGRFGDAEMLSFHATKFLNTFEGGAVATNNDQLAEKMRLMKNFGFSGNDNVIYIGTNGKMSEVSAAMGITSVESMDSFIEVNRRNYHAYKTGLTGIPGIKMMHYDESQSNNYQYIILDVDVSIAGVNRDDFVTLLNAENVLARRYFFPGCHRMEPYRSFQPHAHLLLPVTTQAARRVLALPTGTSIDESDIARICDLLRFVVGHGAEVAALMNSSKQLVD